MPKFLTNRAALSADARRRQLTIALYATVVFLYWVALYIYVPTLPTYVQGKSHHLALVASCWPNTACGRPSSACRWASPPTGWDGTNPLSWQVWRSPAWGRWRWERQRTVGAGPGDHGTGCRDLGAAGRRV